MDCESPLLPGHPAHRGVRPYALLIHTTLKGDRAASSLFIDDPDVVGWQNLRAEVVHEAKMKPRVVLHETDGWPLGEYGLAKSNNTRFLKSRILSD